MTVCFVLLCILVVWGVGCISTYIPREGCGELPAKTKLIVKGADGGQTNSLSYFKSIFEGQAAYSPDGIQIGLYSTRDGALIVLDTDKLSDVSNVPKGIKPGDKSLGEMLQYNFGTAESPENILTLNQLLTYLQTQESLWKKRFSLDIILYDNGMAGERAADTLCQTLVNNGLTDTATVCASVKTGKYLKSKYPEIRLTATGAQSFAFYYSYMFNADLSDVSYNTIIIPPYFAGLNFAKRGLIDYAQKNGIEVYFVTDNAKNARSLKATGVDGIVTTEPMKLYSAL